MLEHLHLEAETEKPRGVGEGTAKEEKGIKEEGKRERKVRFIFINSYP